jgi:perosamine synthetase
VSRLGVWPPPPRRPPTRRLEHLPFPLAEPGGRVFAMARHGLWAGALAVGLKPGDVVLTPTYHHGSEIEALVRAGLTCRFYEPTPALAPDDDELEGLLGPRVRALLLVHSLGFPQDSPRWRRWCDERGLLLIEDGAQSWLARITDRPVGSWGDLSLFSLHKTVGVPDGAALIWRNGEPPVGPAGSAGSRHWFRFKTSPAVDWLRTRLVPHPRYRPLEDFALGDPTQPPTAATTFLLPRLVRPGIPDERRANYAWLRAELAGRVRPLLDDVPPGASPMVFPIEVADKAAALEALVQHGVFALDFWSVPHPLLPVGRFPATAARRARVIGLPVHQDLSARDLGRIAEAAAMTVPAA